MELNQTRDPDGLTARLVFALEADLLTLVRVGNHDDIRRYLMGPSLGK